MKPDLPAYGELVRAYLKRGRFERVEMTLHEALSAVVETDKIYAMLGVVYLQTGRPEDGARVLSEGVRRHCADPMLHLLLGAFLLETRRFVDAVPVLRRALELDPRNALGALFLMSALYALQRWPEAAEAGARAVALGAGGDAPLAALAYAYERVGRIEEAVATTRRALEAAPERVEHRVALARQCLALGEEQEAREALELILARAESSELQAEARCKLDELRGGPRAA
jgi:tetratricopeptide (TPR) repeat protein